MLPPPQVEVGQDTHITAPSSTLDADHPARERERERECVCIYRIYIVIYIYTHLFVRVCV